MLMLLGQLAEFDSMVLFGPLIDWGTTAGLAGVMSSIGTLTTFC